MKRAIVVPQRRKWTNTPFEVLEWVKSLASLVLWWEWRGGAAPSGVQWCLTERGKSCKYHTWWCAHRFPFFLPACLTDRWNARNFRSWQTMFSFTERKPQKFRCPRDSYELAPIFTSLFVSLEIRRLSLVYVSLGWITLSDVASLCVALKRVILRCCS